MPHNFIFLAFYFVLPKRKFAAPDKKAKCLSEFRSFVEFPSRHTQRQGLLESDGPQSGRRLVTNFAATTSVEDKITFFCNTQRKSGEDDNSMRSILADLE